jgi:single-strand DNA-binding protein
MNLNKVMIIGNLTRDPELKTTPTGSQVASFSVATSFNWTDQSGQKQDRSEFHNIVAWRKLAEIIGQYLKKGSKIYIEGRLQTRDWTGQDGVKRYRTEIIAENMIMLDRAGLQGGGNSNYQPRSNNNEYSQVNSNSNEPVIDFGDSVEEDEIKVENIPF